MSEWELAERTAQAQRAIDLLKEGVSAEAVLARVNSMGPRVECWLLRSAMRDGVDEAPDVCCGTCAAWATLDGCAGLCTHRLDAYAEPPVWLTEILRCITHDMDGGWCTEWEEH